MKKDMPENSKKEKTRSSASGKRGKRRGGFNVSRRGKLAIGIVCCVIILLIVVAANITTVLGMFGINSDLSGQLSENKKYSMFTAKETLYSGSDSTAFWGDSELINILVFGLDRTEERDQEYTIYRPDTIMLVSINADGKIITVVSIPRDSYVTIAGHGVKDKINACFAYGASGSTSAEKFAGGLACLEDTVSNLLGGVPINYYIGIDMDGAAGIVDTVGGVDFNISSPIYAKDGTLMYAVGMNHLDGARFVQLARMRNYSEGDIQRVQVQQALIKALFSTVQSMSISKIPKVISQIYAILKTDISITDAYALGMTLIDNLSVDNIVTGTVPGLFGSLKGLSYWIIDQPARVSFIKQYYGVSVSQLAQDPTFIPPDNNYGLTWVLKSSGSPEYDDDGYPILYDKFGFRVQTDQDGEPVLDANGMLIRLGKYIDLGYKTCCDCGCLEGDSLYYCHCDKDCKCTTCHPELLEDDTGTSGNTSGNVSGNSAAGE